MFEITEKINWTASDLEADSVWSNIDFKQKERRPQKDDFIFFGGIEQDYIRFGVCLTEAVWNDNCSIGIVFKGSKSDFIKVYPEIAINVGM